jgi:pyridoxine kinase
MNVLSIQSHVAYGHVGNASAVFPMQRLGVEVWPIHTVQFSNHTGYGSWKGRVFDGPAIEDLVEGIAERGVLGRCDGVLSGYMGSADIGNAILSAVARVRSLNPEALYCCDPVIGDVGRGVFVRPGIPEFMRDKVVPSADVVTPNQFELGFLAGIDPESGPRTLAEVVAAAHRVRETGPSTVLVTSVVHDATPEDALDMVAVSTEGAWEVRTPRLPINPPGAGDLTSAVFLANLLTGHDLPTALARTTSSVFAVMERTAAAGSREMQIVASQHELADPALQFEVASLT